MKKFNAEDLKITNVIPLRPDETKNRQSRQRRKRPDHFIKISLDQVALLQRARSLATLKVYHELLRKDFFEAHGRSFKFGNDVLEDLGTNRQGKSTALRELEALGLIRVKFRSRKSPVITLSCTYS
jgi:hypothetical protein